MTRRSWLTLAAAALFVVLVALANWATSRYGLVDAGAGIVVPAGTLAAGLTFAVRDAVHELAGRWAVLGLIAAGAALSAVLAGPALAAASGLAFLLSETADMGVYTRLRRRSWLAAALLSNTVGALADSTLFLWLAGFPLSGLPDQVLVKVAVTLPVVVLVWWRGRAVLRNPVRAESA